MATRIQNKNKKKINRRIMPSVSEEKIKTVLHPLNKGKLPEFNVNTEDWCVYGELLEQFFEANVTEDERKVSVLITVLRLVQKHTNT